MLRRWRRWGGRRGFEFGYRGLSGLAVFVLLYSLRDAESFVLELIAFSFFSSPLLLGVWMGYHCARRFRSGLWALVITAVAVAGAGAGAVAGALALAGALAAAAAAAADTDAIALAAIVAIVAIGLGAAAGMMRSHSQRPGLLWGAGFGALAGQGIAFATVSDEQATNDSALFFLLFFLILPLANGLFDWLSWWATRALGRRLLGLLGPGQSGWRRGWAIAAHGLADLAIAVALLLLMAYALALGFELYNELGKFQRHEAVYDLRQMVDRAAAAPGHSGFWLAAMLLTTLLPTFGHGLVLLASPLGFLFIPDGPRAALATALEGYKGASRNRQVAIRRRAARWIVQGRALAWLWALLLLVWLLGRCAAFIVLWLDGGLAGVAARAAYAGLDTAEWLGRVLGY